MGGDKCTIVSRMVRVQEELERLRLAMEVVQAMKRNVLDYEAQLNAQARRWNQELETLRMVLSDGTDIQCDPGAD